MQAGRQWVSGWAKPISGFLFPIEWLFRLFVTLIVFVIMPCCHNANAGVMDKDAMLKAFPSPLIVGEKESDLAVWPIFKQEGTETPLIGYVFESLDFAPIPGFSGTPFNLLVALNPRGEFLNVRVLSQHEPVFVDGLGSEPLMRFVEQYKGLSLIQNIKIDTSIDRSGETGGTAAHIDGVAKATASIRILNQTLLSSALKVARARLGYASGRDPDQVARIKSDIFEPMDWDGLLKAGLITKKVFKNREIDAAFKGTVGEGLDVVAANQPDDDFIELYVAYLNVPVVGRNLLPPKAWEYLQSRMDNGDHALLVVGQGRYSFLGDDFVRASAPDRLMLRQKDLPIDIRDFDLADSLDLFNLDYKIKLPEKLKNAEWRVFHVIAPAGLDPSLALDFDLTITRSKGQFYPERVRSKFALQATLPEQYFDAPESDDKTWHSIWRDRALELGILALALAVLFGALLKPDWLVRDARRLRIFRTTYLVFTLGFIGWYAQGQLSIVNITALIQAIVDGRSLSFFLYDPMTVVLWVFIAVTFVLWGRGTFCGWLCPFGALQDLLNQFARFVRIPQLRLRPQFDARLKLIKYAVLAVILVTAVTSVSWTSRLIEIEPFKTSITLIFVRAWPYVLWAAVVLVLSTFVYKGYCRYLCPLGAGMVLLGRLRRFDWLTRRAECGKPCQRCTHACEYQAIKKDGAIHYDECFQCLDCVVIYKSDQLCVPLILEKRKSQSAAQPESPITSFAVAEREGEPA